MKKQAALLFCVLTACALTACGGKSAAKEENTQIPNPFIDCQTLEDAAETAGFALAVPDAIGEYTSRTIQAVEGSMIQVFTRMPTAAEFIFEKASALMTSAATTTIIPKQASKKSAACR